MQLAQNSKKSQAKIMD